MRIYIAWFVCKTAVALDIMAFIDLQLNVRNICMENISYVI